MCCRVIRQNRRRETGPYFFSSLHRADRPQAADQDTQKLQNLASLESNRQFLRRPQYLAVEAADRAAPFRPESPYPGSPPDAYDKNPVGFL
jgi:hypothetical protein